MHGHTAIYLSLQYAGNVQQPTIFNNGLIFRDLNALFIMYRKAGSRQNSSSHGHSSNDMIC